MAFKQKISKIQKAEDEDIAIENNDTYNEFVNSPITKSSCGTTITKDSTTSSRGTKHNYVVF